ncbi:MAG: WG repeat-containing protein, partial [Bacteroidota bacterium]
MRHLTFVLVILISLLFTACQPREDDPTRVPALREQGERLYPVESGGRWGFIDARGDVIIEPHFDWAGEFTNGLALVRQGDRFGYVRRNGEMAIEPQFEDAWHFSEGLAPVQIEGQWGYINEEGQVVVDPQFNLSPEVLEEREVDDAQLRPAWTEDRYGFRRQDGAFEFDARFDDAWY